MAAFSGVKAAFLSMRSERSIAAVTSRSFVGLAELVARLAADAVGAEFRRPWQHQRAAAAVAIDALERQALEHRLPAAGAERLRRDGVGVLHHRVLGGVGAQHLLLARIGTPLGDRLEPERLGQLQRNA